MALLCTSYIVGYYIFALQSNIFPFMRGQTRKTPIGSHILIRIVVCAKIYSGTIHLGHSVENRLKLSLSFLYTIEDNAAKDTNDTFNIKHQIPNS